MLEVIDSRQTRRYGIQYKATYIGNWDEQNSNPPWQPYSNFKNAAEKVQEFHKAHPKKLEPPHQLAM